MNEILKRIDTVKFMVINKLKADDVHNKDVAVGVWHGEIMRLLFIMQYQEDLFDSNVLIHFSKVLLKNLDAKPENYIDNIADALNSLFKKAEIEAKEKMI
jgi:hypothetical protein